METWYSASYGIIEEAEVIKSTAKTVTLKNGRQRYKSSDGDYYAKTREEAKAMLVAHYQQLRDLALFRLDHAELNLNRAKAL